MEKENLEPVKELSSSIKRTGYVGLWPQLKYNYEFLTPQYLEHLDDWSYFGISHESIKEKVIESLVHDFRISLQSIVYGDPAGLPYLEMIREMKDNGEPLTEREEKIYNYNKKK